ncbi:hypothetical protein [Mesorhizobium sp.]|uniref:hypothetical protein n=1 Tax=Mesorhizobium sp. TaxID=1871066 RepID=UPI000FE91B82|nr:hypothetical protein [Mesorhizobium sp.]RWP80458.1 MAG: hypothetical protein EOR10_08415 [Mesorhizobium sp.]
MAMVITFAEPITSLVFRRIIRELEPRTFAKGLTNRQPMQMVSVNFNPTGPQVQQSISSGMQFQKLSLVRVDENQVANKVVEELSIDPNHILYRNMNYSWWENVSGSYWEMCSDSISSIVESVPLRTVRLEYLDRFIYDGDPEAATADGVIRRESELVSPHIFNLTDLWHSHTGKLEKTKGEDRRLFQVNIDMVDMVDDPGSLPRRSISIMSAVEERFGGTGMDSATADTLRATFDDLHDEVKVLFRNAVDSQMLATVGLDNE